MLGDRIADALRAACHPEPLGATSVPAVDVLDIAVWRDSLAPLRARFSAVTGLAGDIGVTTTSVDVDALVVQLFDQEGHSLVRLVRLFVDDRNAAEDLVQEGFIRLARNVGRIHDPAKAPAYLRSIVLNLARDHNRRGLVSLRHHLPFDDARASAEDEIVLRDDQQEVIDALRHLPGRQRDCLVLRYYEELGIDAIAESLGISRNSVKTHLKRGLAAMGERLGVPPTDEELEL